jgi:TetR/AcrR family transcriptional regulator, repressor for neighboring sulfatase
MSHAESPSTVGSRSSLDPEAMERITAAAVDLFSNQHTEVVTAKFIALKAGVPAEHFEDHWTLGQLMALALGDLAERMAVSESSDPRARAELLATYERILVRALISGRNPATLGVRHPELDQRVVELVARTGQSERSARIRASQLCALSWGWRLFRPYLATASGLDAESDAEMDAEFDALERALAALPISG